MGKRVVGEWSLLVDSGPGRFGLADGSGVGGGAVLGSTPGVDVDLSIWGVVGSGGTDFRIIRAVSGHVARLRGGPRLLRGVWNPDTGRL